MIDTITIAGGLPRDAKLEYTNSGRAVTNFTVAQSDRKYNEQSQQWEDVRNLYLDVTIWNDSRQNNPIPWAELADTLSKGDKVAVTGKLHTRKWQDKQGNNRSQIEFLANAFYIIGTQLDMPQQSQPAQSQGNQWGQQAPQAAAWDKQPAQAGHPAGRAGDTDGAPPF
ncbi:MAG: single-stranded DNA-binding protein [Yaniella sp.]|nr:single-stranded DNA-binding protein [Yaniella sp.]